MTVGGTTTGNVTEDGLLTATGTLTAADIDTTDNPLAYTVVTNQVGDNGFGDFSIDASGNWDYDLNNSLPAIQALDAGETLTDTYTFTITNQDGATETQTVSVTVTGTNDAPVITSDGSGATASINVPENTTAVTTVNVSDVDASDSQSYLLSGVDASLFSIDASGNLSFNTAPDFEEPHDANADGIYQVTVTTTDSEGATDSQDLTITVTNVDEAPVPIADSNSATEAGGNVTGNVLGNDTYEGVATVTNVTDDDGDTITIGAAFTTDAGGTLTINSDGSYSYTPPVQGDVPPGGLTEVFTYTVADGDGDTAQSTLNIFVNNNDQPVSAVADSANAAEAGAAVTGNVISNDTAQDAPATINTAVDDDGDTITIGTAFTTDAGGSLILNSDGSYSYTPPPQGSVPPGGLTEVFTYTVSDVDGDTDQATLTIVVLDNDLAPIVSNDSASATEGGTVSTGNIFANDLIGDGPGSVISVTDDDGDIVPVGSPFTTDNGGTLTINSNGTYSYTPPAQGAVGVSGLTEIFTITLADADGDTASSSLTFTVANNDLPVSPQGDTNTAKEAGPAVSGNVLTNDNIPDGGGSVVSVSNAGGGNIPLGTQFTTANGGKLTINANGSYTYTPPPQGSVPTAGLSESFTYTVRDADGDTNQAVLNILVTDNDLTPTATPDTRTVAEGGAAVTGNVRTNDVFPDGVGPVTAAVDDDGHTITIGSAFTTDAGGILIINSNGSYSYTPPALGTVPTAGLTEVFTYTVTDADGDAVQSTLTLTVNNTDTQIIANNDSVTAREGGSIRTGNIFANDIVRDGPASVASVVYGGQQVTIGSTFTTTSGGRLTLNADGTFTYRPPVQGAVPSAGLTDTFTVQVRDADGDISQSSLSFVVANNIVNDQSNTGRPPGNQQGGGAQAPNVNVDTNPDFAPSVGAPESISDNIQVAVVTGTNQPQQPQVQTPQIPDIADLQQSNQILLTGNLQDQVIETGELTVSIQNAFQHTDPTESLRITATLEDGSPLPEYIQYDESSQQFILNADMANAQGITQETIVVRAEDSQGNATDARFNVFAPAATGANTEALNTLSDGGIISMVGDLQDQVLAGGRTTYQVSDAFLHSDPAEVLNITARLEDGSELPDYIQYDSNSQEFTLDSEAAAAAGVEGEVVVVVTAEDSQGNAATSRFSVVDANTAAATGTGIQTTDTGPADTAEASRLTLVSRPLDQRVEIDQQMIVVSIADNFQHTNPLETLTINARLADGSPLPGYIVFDQDNREFFIDGEMARALGINELEVIVEAEDSEGNSVVTRFRVMVDAAEIELEGETDAAAEGDETVMEDTEAAAEGEDNIESDQDLALTSEWESLELVAQGDAELQDLLAALAESDAEMDDELRDFAKENLNNQVLRAGEFGYQQEKMELKTLLEKIFSRG